MKKKLKKYLNDYIDHCRNFGFMSKIKRNKIRVKETHEFFTCIDLVQRALDRFEVQDSELFTDETKTFIDSSCGDGQILSEVVIRKMERSNCTLEQALSTTYGVELMEDNVKLCKERLAGPKPTMKIHKILDKNIICGDTLTYDYSFGEPVGVEKWTGLWRAFKQVMSGSREYF
mgnify:CR=1 FL=1